MTLEMNKPCRNISEYEFEVIANRKKLTKNTHSHLFDAAALNYTHGTIKKFLNGRSSFVIFLKTGLEQRYQDGRHIFFLGKVDVRGRRYDRTNFIHSFFDMVKRKSTVH